MHPIHAIKAGLLGLVLASLSVQVAPVVLASAIPAGQPVITAISLEGKDVVISALVPSGLKKVTLQSSRRLGTGAWEPRAVLRLDGQGGKVTFRVAQSLDLEIVRLRADDSDPLPSSFYRGTNQFSGIALGSSTSPPPPGGVVTFDGAMAPRSNEKSPGEAASRQVVESDIWKIEGDRLYFFNQYRGLQVIDIANPDSPVKLGTLSLPASGEQMYVLSERYLALLARDGCRWGTALESQVMIIDTTDGNPSVATALALKGQIQESRLVGTALYVTTQTYQPVADGREGAWEWGTVLSAFDLSNPAVPVARPTLWYPGYGNVLTATDRYVFVSVADGSNSSLVHCIDISAPDGTMVKAGSIRVAGQVKDKFKMHLNGDVFTVISEKWAWQFPNNTGRWRPVTVLETFSLANSLAPAKLGELNLADGEQLHATRFDGDRVYVVTFFRVDPLWVVDLSDPARPTVQGELEVPGWSTYIQPLGDRLLAIGIDSTNGWRVAVSLFDVHDPATPSLLSKVPLGEDHSWSEATSDEKAFGFIPEAGLVLVPYASYTTNHQEGVQLIDFNGDTLVKRGFIAHDLQARRSTIHRDRILSISGRELLGVDASDRDRPVVRSETELAWPVDRVFVQGEYLVELETNAGGGFGGGVPAVRIAPAADPDRVLNTLSLTNLPVAGATAREGRLYILQGLSTYSPPIILDKDSGTETPGTNETALVCSVLDLSQLPELSLLGSTDVSTGGSFGGSADPVWPRSDLLVWVTRQAYYWRDWVYGWRGLGPAEVIDVGAGIAVPFAPVRSAPFIWYPPYGGYGDAKLFAVDLTETASPQFVSEVDLSSTNGWSSFSQPFTADKLVYLSERSNETSITGTNYYVYTNTTYTLVTNTVTVTNMIKTPHYSTETNLTLVTNITLALVQNKLLQPVTLGADSANPASVIAAGSIHSLALTADGQVWSWGGNSHGQLGEALEADRREPNVVAGLASVISIASGSFHNLTLRSDGSVWAWGDDALGQLGNGSAPGDPNLPPLPEPGSSSPVQVIDLGAVRGIAAGYFHSLALKSDGTVWGWGANWAGQLGDATFDNRNRPVRVTQLENVIAVAAGAQHSVALRNDGTVWAWGANKSGELGLETADGVRAVPGEVPGLSDITGLACGHSHSLALRRDGSVWAWGRNEFGQLGDGTTADRAQPQIVSGLSEVAAIACGQGHSLALGRDGSIWAWGRAEAGQLGSGTTVNATKPVPVAEAPRAVAVAAGDNHSLAVDPAGDVYAWGSNRNGQLGSGEFLLRTNVVTNTEIVKVTTWTEETEVVERDRVIKVPESTVVTNAQPIYTTRQLDYLHVVDYTAPSAPVLRKPVSIPGMLRGLSNAGALLYLVGYNPDSNAAPDGLEWLHACAYDGVASYLVDSHPLPKDWPHALLVGEPHILITRPEVDKASTRALEIWELAESGKFTRLNERPLRTNASSMAAFGDLLAVQEDDGIELFDATKPLELPAVGQGGPASCLGWNLEHATGSLANGLWLPLGLYGAYRIEVRR